MMYKVRFSKSHKSIEVPAGKTVLECAQAAGIEI